MTAQHFYFVIHNFYIYRQSYDVDLDIGLDGTTIRTRNTVDLKNPYFRYTGSTPQPPAGCNNESPTQVYWSLASNGDNSHGVNSVNSNAVGGGGGGGCSPSVMMGGESMTNTAGMHSNSLYNNTGMLNSIFHGENCFLVKKNIGFGPKKDKFVDNM